jgi:DUF4097 and DUF4098 domain-containing protein YvlB
MLVLILLLIIISATVYLTMKKNSYKQKNQQCTQQINESTFNPNYKISRDENGLEIVQSCGR